MQEALGLGAIGGKDSMSGTFNDIHVPPTLVSFAIAPGKASEAVSQELKKEGDVLVLFGMPKDKEGMPDLDVLKKHADFLYQEVKAGHVAAMKAVDHGGVAVTAAKMAFGNGLGIHFTENLPLPKFFDNFSAPSLWKLRRKKHSALPKNRIQRSWALSAEIPWSSTANPSLSRIFCRPMKTAGSHLPAAGRKH